MVKDSAGEPVEGATVIVNQVWLLSCCYDGEYECAYNDCGDDNGNKDDHGNSNHVDISGRVGSVEEECDNKRERRVLATAHARWAH